MFVRFLVRGDPKFTLYKRGRSRQDRAYVVRARDIKRVGLSRAGVRTLDVEQLGRDLRPARLVIWVVELQEVRVLEPLHDRTAVLWVELQQLTQQRERVGLRLRVELACRAGTIARA